MVIDSAHLTSIHVISSSYPLRCYPRVEIHFRPASLSEMKDRLYDKDMVFPGGRKQHNAMGTIH